jgi:hypothetical protein
MPLDATDDEQLLGATSQGRCVFTFNIRDFLVLAEAHPDHCGIILAAQRRWSLSDLISTLDGVLSQCEGEDLAGQVRWLNDWRLKS